MHRLHHPAAERRRGGDQLRLPEQLEGQRRAADVDDAVHRAHLVEVDRFQRDVVDLRLRAADDLEHRACLRLRPRRQGARVDAAARRRRPRGPLESVHRGGPRGRARWDSIVKICGAALALEMFSQPALVSAPPPLGSGMVETMPGRLPVPAPATLEIRRDLQVSFEVQGETHVPHRSPCSVALSRPGPRRRRGSCAPAAGSGTASSQERPTAPGLDGRPGVVAVCRCGSWRSRSAGHPTAARVPGGDVLAHAALGAWAPRGPGRAGPVTCSRSRRGQRAGSRWCGGSSRVPHAGSAGLAGPANCARPCHVEVELHHGPVRVKVGSLDGEKPNAAPDRGVQRPGRWAGVPLSRYGPRPWRRTLAAAAAPGRRSKTTRRTRCPNSSGTRSFSSTAENRGGPEAHGRGVLDQAQRTFEDLRDPAQQERLKARVAELRTWAMSKFEEARIAPRTRSASSARKRHPPGRPTRRPAAKKGKGASGTTGAPAAERRGQSAAGADVPARDARHLCHNQQLR